MLLGVSPYPPYPPPVQVFAFAFADSTKVESVEGKSWGCAGYAIGIVDSLLKVMYGR